MPYKTICGHSWQPVPGYKRRFKCEWCGALGYTRPAAPGARKAQLKMFVYRCSVKGCTAPATVVRRSGGTMVYQRCKQHDTENV
jgi:hypothetical protein